MFEICTSTKGKLVASNASRMETLVCVKAAGLRMTAVLCLGEDDVAGEEEALGGTKCD